MIISVINIYEGIKKKKTPLGPRVQGMQIFPRWPCLRYILLLFWRHSSTAITPSVLLSFSSFFLQGIWILIHPPPLPPPPLHVICCFWSLNPYLRISPHFFEDATLFVVRRIRERTRVQKKPTADANEIPGKIRGGFWSKLAYPRHMKWAFPPKSWHISAAQDKFTI